MSSPDDTSAPDGEVPPTQAIVEAIAAAEGVDVIDIEPPEYEPLYAVVNPEALDDLFRTASDSPRIDAQVVLEYEGYEVVVHADGRVDVDDSSSGGSGSDGSINGPIEE